MPLSNRVMSEKSSTQSSRPSSAAARQTSKPHGNDRNAVPIKNDVTEQMRNVWAAATYFCSGAIAINASQLLAQPLSSLNKEWYESWMTLTKGTFGLLTTTMTQLWAPTTIRLSGDASMRGQMYSTVSGDVVLNFPSRLILTANHQIYTDWLYLWWAAYAAGRHADVCIVLKESLRRLPIIGWGMHLNRFIFLKRDWAADKAALATHMRRLSGDKAPMWLMLFPEGTNLAVSTRMKSAAWAKKNRLKDMHHTLLPRATGLRFCLCELKGSVEWLYDCTIAYHGVPRGRFAHDIFPLPQSYAEGRPPRDVSMFWRRFRISSIPLDNPIAFESWLLARWREKDTLIEYWYTHDQCFPADKGIEVDGRTGEFRRGAGLLTTQVKANKWKDFLQVLAPMAGLAMILLVFYGALPKELSDGLAKQMRNLMGGQDATSLGGEKKLLAFDGSGFREVDKDRKKETPNKRLKQKTNVESTSEANKLPKTRPPLISSTVSNPPNGTPPKLPPPRAQSTASEPKRMLGFSNGQFMKVSSSGRGSVSSAPARAKGPEGPMKTNTLTSAKVGDGVNSNRTTSQRPAQTSGTPQTRLTNKNSGKTRQLNGLQV